MIESDKVFGLASDMGAGCRVSTCLPGRLSMSVFLCRLGGSLSGGGARVPLASHEGEYTGRKERKKSVMLENECIQVKGK